MISISQTIYSSKFAIHPYFRFAEPQIISRMRRDKSEVASQKASLCFHTPSDLLIIQILGHCLAMPPTARFLSPLTLQGTGTSHTTWRYSDQ